MERAQLKLVTARRELLQATPISNIDKLRERAAELDRRQRDLELDLRTEQALQELRMKLVAEARKRLQDVRARRAEAVSRNAAAQDKVAGLNIPEKPDERTRAMIAKVQEEASRSGTQLDLCAREQSSVEHDLDDLANQSRGATLKLHELATRRTLTADEIKRTLDEIAVAADRAVAMVPLQQAVAEAEAELMLLREQYAEAARRRAAMQPVRVELWR